MWGELLLCWWAPLVRPEGELPTGGKAKGREAKKKGGRSPAGCSP